MSTPVPPVNEHAPLWLVVPLVALLIFSGYMAITGYQEEKAEEARAVDYDTSKCEVPR